MNLNNDAPETELLKFSLKNENFKNISVDFILDTGAQANLIKNRSLNSTVSINSNVIYNLIGVGEGTYKTLGQVEIEINGVISKFQVISDDFPIREEGLVGLPFCRHNKIQIDFDHASGAEGMIINNKFVAFEKTENAFYAPARSKTCVRIALKPTKQKYGYIRRVDIGPGVYLGEALVQNINGFAKLYVINSNPENLEVSVFGNTGAIR